MKTKIKNEILKMETYAKFPYLIEITYIHNDNTEEIFRFANSNEDIVFTEIENGKVVEKTFTAGFFTITPPERNGNEITDAKITISAVDQEWIQKIRNSNKRSKIRFLAVIQYKENNIESVEPIEDLEFELAQANWNETEIQWTMEYDTLQDVLIPLDEMDSYNCPQLG